MSIPSAISSDLFEIKETPFGGRGVYSTAPIAKGTPLMTCGTPFASVVFKPFKKEVCAFCYRYEINRTWKIRLDHPPTSTKKDRQRTYAGVVFCSPECRESWSLHYDSDGLLSHSLDLIEKHVKWADEGHNRVIASDGIDSAWATASTLKKAKPAHLVLEPEEYDTARLVVEVVVNKFRDVSTIQDFECLQSNELQQLSIFPELLASHIAIYQFLQQVLPQQVKPFLTTQLVRDTVGREAGNAFGIWQLPLTIESECLGSAIFAQGSFFNHSCEPNVLKERIGSAMHFTALRDIAPDEQLCISYGMFKQLDVTKRIDELLRQWHFECRCDKCVADLAAGEWAKL
ncbi:potential protein lysine methyltransferase Set6p [Trichomonascus vanleenenianus]|uniref:Set6p n=1 Tax=Trichomonascus vanleenenianus TaxID=2268995 RepID=UPI003ECAD49B